MYDFNHIKQTVINYYNFISHPLSILPSALSIDVSFNLHRYHRAVKVIKHHSTAKSTTPLMWRAKAIKWKRKKKYATMTWSVTTGITILKKLKEIKHHTIKFYSEELKRIGHVHTTIRDFFFFQKRQTSITVFNKYANI